MAKKYYITVAKAGAYDAVISVFTALIKEVRELAKKKADATLNPMKVKLINRILEDVTALMHGEPEEKYLDLLSDADLPQFADALLVMSQHEGALSAFRDRYHGYHPEKRDDDWFINQNDRDDE